MFYLTLSISSYFMHFNIFEIRLKLIGRSSCRKYLNQNLYKHFKKLSHQLFINKCNSRQFYKHSYRLKKFKSSNILQKVSLNHQLHLGLLKIFCVWRKFCWGHNILSFSCYSTRNTPLQNESPSVPGSFVILCTVFRLSALTRTDAKRTMHFHFFFLW